MYTFCLASFTVNGSSNLQYFAARGACAGVCAVDQLPTVMAELPTTCQTTIENFVKENSCTDSSCNQYKYFYDRFFGDRTRICKYVHLGLRNCSFLEVYHLVMQMINLKYNIHLTFYLSLW